MSNKIIGREQLVDNNKKYESIKLGEGGVFDDGDEGVLEELGDGVAVAGVLLEADLDEVLGLL